MTPNKPQQHINQTTITMKAISSAQNKPILSLLDSGLSGHEISSQTGVSNAFISRLCSRYRPYLNESQGGCHSGLSDHNIHYALRLIGTGKAENAVQVTKTLSNIVNQPISAQTVRNGMKKAGMKAVVKKKGPLLSKKHRQERLDFALSHQDWTVDDWRRVVWSDETKINRLGSDGPKWVWKNAGEGLSDRLVEGTKKFGGGSVMVWGCMMWEGVGYACRIDGRMDGDLYIKILDEEFEESIKFYHKTKDDIIFQQDNDPKHTCKKASTWFKDHHYEVLPWPAQSPDLNPIEHLWSHLKKRLTNYEVPHRGVFIRKIFFVLMYLECT